jgi:hypothetical protein
MDTRISAGTARLDVTPTDSAPRVTPSSGVPFREMLARGTGAIVQGAEAAVMALPGAPIVAAAIRPGGTSGAASAASATLPTSSGTGSLGAGATLPIGTTVQGSAESPVGGVSVATGTGRESGSVEQALAQSQEYNLYYLQLQEQLAAENRSYTAMSNVLKTRHDTVKNAIGNIR